MGAAKELRVLLAHLQRSSGEIVMLGIIQPSVESPFLPFTLFFESLSLRAKLEGYREKEWMVTDVGVQTTSRSGNS